MVNSLESGVNKLVSGGNELIRNKGAEILLMWLYLTYQVIGMS